MSKRQIKTVTELAAKVGRDKSSVSRWIAREDWPFGQAPWPLAIVPKVEAWWDEHIGINPTLQDAKLNLLIERAAKVRMERELLAGLYMKKEEVERGQVQRIYSVRAKMQEVPLRAHLLVGKTEMEIEAILTDWMRGICDYYANGGN